MEKAGHGLTQKTRYAHMIILPSPYCNALLRLRVMRLISNIIFGGVIIVLAY